MNKTGKLVTLLGLAAIVPAAALAVGRKRSKPKTISGSRGQRVNHPALGKSITTCGKRPGAINVCVTRPDKPGPVIDNPDSACRLLRKAADSDRESFYAILLDAQSRVAGIEEVARGHVTSVAVHPREVFKAAALSNATAIVVAHNHPSDSKNVSADDRELTKRLKKVGDMMGIPVLDSLVVTSKGCTSVDS